jgi:hypothetical protein
MNRALVRLIVDIEIDADWHKPETFPAIVRDLLDVADIDGDVLDVTIDAWLSAAREQP